MESKRVQRLKFAIQPLIFNFFLCLLTTALLLAMTPVNGLTQISINPEGFLPCDVPGSCFAPDGQSTPDQVTGATVFVGDTLQWKATCNNGGAFTVTASTTQGDYQGRTCPEPGGLSALFTTNEDMYRHTFLEPQDCYYRSTYQPPGTGYASYPGMQGVVHVLQRTGPSAYWLMPVNISTAPAAAAQTFTAFYADPGLYSDISDARLTLAGVSHAETLHYNPVSNTFTLQGAGGMCRPGDSATLSDGNLTLDCSTSTAVGSGTFLTVTYNLTPQQSLSGSPYQLSVFASEMGGATNSKTLGTWTINRPPSVGTSSPMSSTTPVGTQQTLTIVYSDPDGYQNIAAANFYMSGNGGVINQWLHYLVAPNVFTMMGTTDVCNPGQAKTLSNGSLSFNCATSTVSNSGTNMTVVFKVTPLQGSIMYQFFNAASDQTGAAFGASGGNWQIP
jgi:hypothetical protein